MPPPLIAIGRKIDKAAPITRNSHMPFTPASRMQRVQPSAIKELLQLGADPSIISFGGGYPDASMFPLTDLAAVYADVIAQHGETSLQYTMSEGSPQLRAQIAEMMRADGMAATADDILILQGSQQGLDFAAKMLVNPDDVVITEDPTFLGALIAFNPCQPTYATVPMDSDGMRMDALEQTLKENPRAKMIYTVPDFQNPTGVTLSLDRRHRLIELANRFDLMVVEDTPYRQIRFQGDSLPTLRSLDSDGRVIHLGSFSKILAPGMRLGWALASPIPLAGLSLLKVAADTQTSTLNMAAACLYLERHDLAAHIAGLRANYRRKKDLMLNAIRRHFPQDITHTDPQGGLFTWLTFPKGFDAAAFMRDHALPEARVAYVPGGSFFAVTQQANTARLNYSAQSDARIEQGIAALGQSLKNWFAANA